MEFHLFKEQVRKLIKNLFRLSDSRYKSTTTMWLFFPLVNLPHSSTNVTLDCGTGCLVWLNSSLLIQLCVLRIKIDHPSWSCSGCCLFPNFRWSPATVYLFRQSSREMKNLTLRNRFMQEKSSYQKTDKEFSDVSEIDLMCLARLQSIFSPSVHILHISQPLRRFSFSSHSKTRWSWPVYCGYP